MPSLKRNVPLESEEHLAENNQSVKSCFCVTCSTNRLTVNKALARVAGGMCARSCVWWDAACACEAHSVGDLPS
jgi:hypothetical protein